MLCKVAYDMLSCTHCKMSGLMEYVVFKGQTCLYWICFVVCIKDTHVLNFVQDECGRCSQRGEPEHPGDEQPGHLAGLPAADHCPACGVTQHPFPQCACGVDPHQCHTQPGQYVCLWHGQKALRTLLFGLCEPSRARVF